MDCLNRDQIANVAQYLLRLSDSAEPAMHLAAPMVVREPPMPSADHRDARLDQVCREQRNRKRRTALLASDDRIFADPAWDILLELYEATLRGKKLNASVIGLDADIAQSTALRWLTMLEKMGLVRRTQDIFDKRRQWVGLTTRAIRGFDQYFA